MKKYIIVVPDHITETGGSPGGEFSQQRETTVEMIRRALTIEDYHENYIFRERIRIHQVAVRPGICSCINKTIKMLRKMFN